MSSFRGTKALLMQLVRSNVSPESRPEIFKALVCIAYLVSLLGCPVKYRLAVHMQKPSTPKRRCHVPSACENLLFVPAIALLVNGWFPIATTTLYKPFTG